MPRNHPRTLIILALLLLALFAVSAHSFNSRMELIVWGGVSGAGDDVWVMPVRFEAPHSLWRFFVRVQDVSYTTTYFESTSAWRDEDQGYKRKDPMHLTQHPAKAKEWNETKATLSPVRGSYPPVNILVEVQRMRPYDGTPEPRTVVVSYTFLGIKRDITWTMPIMLILDPMTLH